MELAGDRVFNPLSSGFVGVDGVSTARGDLNSSVHRRSPVKSQ